jgi:Nickel responsive protein SCO4226-like
MIEMKRYVIERDLPRVGSLDGNGLSAAASTSNEALARLGGKVQWVESFVADDKTFCVYLAESEGAVHEHARLSGFPASKVTEIRAVIDPMTAKA